MSEYLATAAARPMIGSGGVHDMGGVLLPSISMLEGSLLLARDSQTTLSQWELRVHALLVLLCSKSLMTTDEMRRGVEGLEREAYASWGYYDRWVVERHVITQGDIDRQLYEERDGSHTESSPSSPSILFKEGDIVRVRSEDGRLRWRKPHLRCPGYIFGQTGTIERYLGCFRDPYCLAFRSTAPMLPLYSVSFSLSVLWSGESYAPPPSSSSSGDTIILDIYQDWLESVHDNSPIHNHHIDDNHHEHSHITGDRQLTADHSIEKQLHTHDHTQHSSRHDHDHDHDHQSRFEVECKAIEREENARCNGPGEVITESLLIILEGNYDSDS